MPHASNQQPEKNKPRRWRPTFSLTDSRGVVWLPTAALSVLLLVLGLLGAAVWRDWEDERRDTLIQDILWLEQAFRLRFDSLEEWSGMIGSEIAKRDMTESHFSAAAKLLIRENPEIARIERLDTNGHVRWHIGRFVDVPQQGGDKGGRYSLLDTLDVARRLTEPSYSDVYRLADHEPLVDLVAPIYIGKQFAGGIRLTFSLSQLLYHQVPWWIGQKYQISVVDLGGEVLATKFQLAERPGALSHEIEFTPPGHGLRLKATAYRVGVGMAMPVLGGVSLLLMALLVASLWKIRLDIKTRNRVERALRREMALRSAIENSMKNGLIAIDLSGRITRVNRALCDMLGVPAEMLVGQAPPYSFWPADRQADLDEMLTRIAEDRIPSLGFELLFERRNGGRFDVRLYLTPLVDEGGRQTGWLASFYDITEHKRKRMAVAAAQERLATVLNGLDAPVCVSRCVDRQLLFSNRAFEENMVRAEQDAPFCVVLPWPRDTRNDEDVIDCELTFPGSPRVYQIHRRRIEWVDGEAAWLGIYADITESKRLAERERQHAEKLQSTARLVTMGEMASTLAHEINQPLAVIATYSTGCLKKMDLPGFDREQLRAPLEKIAEQARRAGQIVHGIRGFVKKRAPQLAPVDINAVVESVLTLAGPVMRVQGVRLEASLSECRAADVDRVLIEQVLLNLVNNAVEAMRDAGIAKPMLSICTREAGGMVEVEVTDNGPGIAPELAEQLFMPFFTTKAEGMGIGLNICRSVIEYHRGEFELEPAPGGGCRFRFRLPVRLETAGVV